MSENENKNILFVDDEESILDVAQEFFQSRGYTVYTAANGKIAAEMIGKVKIDCCFTDINMPEMDGLELAEHIRKYDNTLPVIVMTGYPSLENTIKTLKNGVVDFLVKPVNLKQMELSVRRVLRERELFIENVILTKDVESKRRIEKINKELLYKVDELNTLNRIMADFASISAGSDVFQRLVDMALELSRADEARLFVVNEVTNNPYEIATAYSGKQLGAWDLGGPHVNGAEGTVPEGLAPGNREALQAMVLEIQSDRKPLLIPRNSENGIVPRDIRSLMLVPLNIREKVFGVLCASVITGDVRFSEKDLYYLSFMSNRAASAIENLALYENIFENLFSTLYAFVKAIEARDPYTERHSSRVSRIAIALCRGMGGSEEDQDILKVAGRLHDIGKIGIRDEILLKPDRLTAEEFDIIKQHPIIGAEIVGQLGLWDREKEIIRHHHERWDGKGYPDGIAGEEIPFLARILAVADVYDAIASERAYRKKMEESKILSIMYGGAGTQFDPEVIECFRRLYEDGTLPAITVDDT